jgi:hypothetical protein
MIIDSVPNSISDPILTLLESDQVPWVFGNEGVKELDTAGYYDSPQFTHTMIEEDYAGDVHPAVHNLWKYVYKAHKEVAEDFVKLYRIKCNMVTRGKDSVPHVPHLDRYTPHTVMIYYVNDCDGNTIIFNGEEEVRITPEKGKYVIFSGDLKHCGTSPIVSNYRLLINFNF